MIRRPPRSTQSRSSAASDVYKRRHRTGHDCLLDAGVAQLLEVIRTQRDQTEQRVVVGAVDEGVIGQRGAHAATAATAMAAIAAEGEVLLVTHFLHGRDVVVVGVVQTAERRLRAHETDSYLVCRLLLEK